MNAYTISRLAEDAGVSIHVVRDYVLRGLLRPAWRTQSGYGIFDERSLARLRFVRAAVESGIGLDELTRLCRALDANDGTGVTGCIERLVRLIAIRQAALAAIEIQLADLVRCVDKGHIHA